MDKLTEPEFGHDPNWPRLLTGIQERRAEIEKKKFNLFVGLSVVSIFRFWREKFYYNKKALPFLTVLALFPAASYGIASWYYEDVYVSAAEINNANEQKFIQEYKELYKKAKDSNINIPNKLIY